MFLLGVFVGRGTITIQFDKEQDTPDLKLLYTNEENSTDKDTEDWRIKKEDLGFYETLKSSDPHPLADENITAAKLTARQK